MTDPRSLAIVSAHWAWLYDRPTLVVAFAGARGARIVAECVKPALLDRGVVLLLPLTDDDDTWISALPPVRIGDSTVDGGFIRHRGVARLARDFLEATLDGSFTPRQITV